MFLEVRRPEAEVLVRGGVHGSGKVDIVDLSAQVGLTSAKEETTGHPVNVRVLQEVGSRRPLSSPAAEPDHLLAACKVVDDSSSGVSGEGATGTILGDLPSSGRIDDLGRVVEHVLGAHGGSKLNVGSLEASAVGKANQLLDISATAANTGIGGRASKGRLGVGINANETNTEGSLVSVDSVVLVNAHSRAPVTAVVFIGEFAERDNATVVALGSRSVQSRKLESGLGNGHHLVWDSITLETRDHRVWVISSSNENENGRVDVRAHSWGKGCGGDCGRRGGSTLAGCDSWSVDG
jgi:hypothetical protein